MSILSRLEASTTIRSLQPGDRISHYRVLSLLGSGGMGEVYLARDETLERSVALKILPPHLVRNEERVRRFMIEAKTASSLSHPHIVVIHEIGQDHVRSGDGADEAAGPVEPSDPVHFISMELVSGVTLGRKIYQEKTDLKTLLGYLAQAAEGLAKAHAAGIIHRDLKPANIMVSTDGYAKILDFGLAKLTEKQTPEAELTSAPTETARQTGGGVVMGTVGYMSPEQIRGKPVDARSDIFSFGCILYEAATRRKPFDADSDVETMHRILQEKPVPVEEINPQIPMDVRRLIRRCLAKSPDQRVQSVKDLAIELREIAEQYDTLPRSSSSGGTIPASAAPSGAFPAVGRGRRLALSAGIGILIVVALAAFLFRERWMPGSGVSESGGGDSTPVTVTSLLSRSDIGDFAISADGRYLAWVNRVDGSVNVRQLATGSDVQVVPPQATARPLSLRFSPDGNHLVYTVREDPSQPVASLFEIPSFGGPSRRRIRDIDSAPAFAPDGKRVCFYRHVTREKKSTLVVADLATGEERILASLVSPQGFFFSLAWSPDGGQISTVVSNENRGPMRLMVIDTASGVTKTIGHERWQALPGITWVSGGRALVVSGVDPDRPTDTPLWRLTYPEGVVSRITKDSGKYLGPMSSKDGRSVAALRGTTTGNLWAIAAKEGASARQITFGASMETAVGAGVSISEEGILLFVMPQDGQHHLWTVKADGTGLRQITQGLRGVQSAREWIPGRSGVALAAAGTDLIAHVWRVDADGGNPRQLTQGNGEWPQGASNDGRWVYFTRTDRPGELWKISPDGGEAGIFLDHFRGNLNGGSPDGKRLLYLTDEGPEDGSSTSWRIAPLEGGEPIMTFVLPRNSADMEWMPGGQSVSYLRRDSDGNRSIWRHALDERDDTEILSFPERRVMDHEWSPGRGRLMIRRQIGNVSSLWIQEPGGAAPWRLVEFPTGTILDADWSLSGEEVYFTNMNLASEVVLVEGFD